MSGTTFKLAGFIGLSMLAHGLLLLHQKPSSVLTVHPTIGSPMLSISLAANDHSADEPSQQQPDKTADPARVNIKTTHTGVEKVTPAESRDYYPDKGSRQAGTIQNTVNVSAKIDIANVPATPVSPQATFPEQKSQTAIASREKTGSADQRNFLLGEIHHRLSRYMNYPARARRRGWEGSVMIGFNIDRQGYLQNIRLTQTSGYTLLDNAALTAIKKVNSIPLNLWGETFQPVALQVPVVYRLTNG